MEVFYLESYGDDKTNAMEVFLLALHWLEKL